MQVLLKLYVMVTMVMEVVTSSPLTSTAEEQSHSSPTVRGSTLQSDHLLPTVGPLMWLASDVWVRVMGRGHVVCVGREGGMGR